MCVCVCMYACMYHTYLCVYVCMYEWMCICMFHVRGFPRHVDKERLQTRFMFSYIMPLTENSVCSSQITCWITRPVSVLISLLYLRQAYMREGRNEPENMTYILATLATFLGIGEMFMHWTVRCSHLDACTVNCFHQHHLGPGQHACQRCLPALPCKKARMFSYVAHIKRHTALPTCT